MSAVVKPAAPLLAGPDRLNHAVDAALTEMGRAHEALRRARPHQLERCAERLRAAQRAHVAAGLARDAAEVGR